MSVVYVFLIGLVLSFVGSVPLAGPVSVMVVSRGVLGRHAEAIKLGLGAALGEGLYAGFAFAGFATFAQEHAAAVPISRALTFVVLLAVGIHFVRWAPKEEAADGKKETGRGAFFLGLTTSLLNPTLLVTWSAVSTGIYSRQIVTMTRSLAIPFGLSVMLGIAAWNTILTLLLRRYRDRFPKKALTWFVRGMGLLLIAIALWSGISLLRQYL